MKRLFRSILLHSASLFAFGLPSVLAAQGGAVAGRVLDLRTGLPVASAEVALADGSLATLTLQDGTYTLAPVAPGPTTLRVRRVGYLSAEGAVTAPVAGNTSVLDFAIRRDALDLDARIQHAIPAGSRRRELGFAVATVHVANAAEDAGFSNWQDLLTARVPGLRFSRLSGNLGTGSPLTLRSGASFSLGRTQPLIYIDGVRVNSDPNTGPVIGSGRNVNALDDIAPDDVESVEVLRGPAATSLYGTDAAAGIIHIVTKRGTLGSPRFTATMTRGANYLADPAGRLGTMWACPYDNSPVSSGANEIYAGVAGVPTGSDATLCNEAGELFSYNMYEETNRYVRDGYFPWPTPTLYQDGLAQSVDLEVRGGTKTVRYFLSSSYEDEAGYVHYNTNEAMRLRGNLGIDLREGLSLDLATAYSNGFTRFGSPVTGDGGEWQDMVWSNGTWLSENIPFGSQVTQTNGLVRTIGDPRLGGFQEKLPSDIPENESTREYNRFTGSLTMRHQTPEFRVAGVRASVTQRATAGIDKGWDINANVFPVENGIVPAHLVQYFPVNYRWREAYPENLEGTAAYERPITTNINVDYSATADIALNDAWSATTSFGAQYSKQELDFFQNAGAGFTTASSRTINQIRQTNILTGYSVVGSKSLGGYVRQQVGFRDRAFLVASLRVDDNSTFGDLVGSQTFPGLSGSWVVSEEPFWPLAAVGSFRVRSAWGKAGRQPSPLSNESIFTTSTALGDLQVIRPATFGNPYITPEVTSEFEIGFDLSAWDDRVAGTFTRFWRTTEGAILEVDSPTSIGFPGTGSENLGRIGGWGWEATVSAQVYSGGWVSADVEIGTDHVDNEIQDLQGYLAPPALGLGLPYPNEVNDDLVVEAQWDAAGPATNAFGQRVSATCDGGVSLAPDPNAPNAARYGRTAGGTAVPCPAIPNRWVNMGPAFASHTVTVAPRLRFLHDRLHVFALAEGQYGRWREANDREWSHNYYNTKVARLQDDPQWVYAAAVGDDTARSAYDAAFWRLREIGARFTLPESWIGLAGAERAVVSLSARNAWILWQAQKRIHGAVISDPEFGTATLDGDANLYETPAMSQVNLTLRVTF
ncbi:MAG: TonB-dependent receptor plug domain-containing protein [Longimicrobiales bacterium]